MISSGEQEIASPRWMGQAGVPSLQDSGRKRVDLSNNSPANQHSEMALKSSIWRTHHLLPLRRIFLFCLMRIWGDKNRVPDFIYVVRFPSLEEFVSFMYKQNKTYSSVFSAED